ncbi:MAG: hypothetical protein LBC85_11780 [Fibromonadaceae bacterium]|jgi:hypothetical protein|nr:hypothetical protein [Fibromonadaceae bacterium]
MNKYRFYLIALLLASLAHSGEYWNVALGASSMKMLSMPAEPRQAALAGAGVASPKNAGEAFRNPLAGAAVDYSTLSFSRTEFSNLIGANRVSMMAHTMLGSWHLTVGMEALNYDKIQGYTEDGLTSNGLFFSAGAIAMQFGTAKSFNSLSAGLTARYANQNIESHNVEGVLFDGGVKYDLLKNFSFGAIFSNFGWLSSSTEAEEIAPLLFQAGITASHALPLDFTGALSTDLYRRTDSKIELRTGLEFIYKELFSLRFGYPVSGSINDALCAGFAVKLGAVAVEYAYQNRTVLEANHIFGITLDF